MSVNNNIEVPNEYSADFWRLLTDNFNIILTKRKHSPDGENLYVELQIVKSK